MENLIKKFLSIDHCDGFGEGSGEGYGYRSGYGFGRGNGTDYGDGSGRGNGYSDDNGADAGSGCGFGAGEGYSGGDGHGDGYGDGIKEYQGQKVWIVDEVETIIDSVHANFAVGKTINPDLTTTACYIAKVGNFFAHGETLRKAFADATDKYNENKPIKDRIADFIELYPTLESIAEHSELYRWHHVLTGSCEFGRDAFAQSHNLDKEHGTMSVKAFIELTKNAYGSDVIRELENCYLR